MAPQASLVSTSNESQVPNNLGDGTQVGASISSLVGFYGATPQSQPTNAAQAQITDSSGGSASPTTGIQALTSSYNSTLIGNAIATLAAQGNAIRNALVSLGIIKGA